MWGKKLPDLVNKRTPLGEFFLKVHHYAGEFVDILKSEGEESVPKLLLTQIINATGKKNTQI